ncbi:uncharacterized protein BO95DRAFT_170618 [Aspergillus brunneoviolaceus CBS 621.78]|uniref:Uncharacterized protein n=1 Tax=Aspergillus brunneoviolaceus CBS 621.78 TaxID=1450534 RepID=A0ACD1G5N7_9EURO|nr:hypothetical protein BO95DRAFT_170618 [Aspergillus brunneoviolaceus CBS 621.78]RAH44543.1 hypothetical protein BO95DRAFT_170618 [Aspergillus brunneoviolaceus CBS 621.78]
MLTSDVTMIDLWASQVHSSAHSIRYPLDGGQIVRQVSLGIDFSVSGDRPSANLQHMYTCTIVASKNERTNKINSTSQLNPAKTTSGHRIVKGYVSQEALSSYAVGPPCLQLPMPGPRADQPAQRHSHSLTHSMGWRFVGYACQAHENTSCPSKVEPQV